MSNQINLTETLEQLNDIAEWFDQQTQVDVEVGLSKVKEAAALIKASKARLKEIENEFVEIKAEIQSSDTDMVKTGEEPELVVVEAHADQSLGTEEIADDIPF